MQECLQGLCAPCRACDFRALWSGPSFPTVYRSVTSYPPLLPKQRNGAFDVPSYRTLFLPPRQLCLGNTKTVNGVGDWSAEVFLGMRIKIGLRVFGQFPNAMSLSLPGTASVQSSWQ